MLETRLMGRHTAPSNGIHAVRNGDEEAQFVGRRARCQGDVIETLLANGDAEAITVTVRAGGARQ